MGPTWLGLSETGNGRGTTLHPSYSHRLRTPAAPDTTASLAQKRAGMDEPAPVRVPSSRWDPRGSVSPRPGMGVEQRLTQAIRTDFEPPLPRKETRWYPGQRGFEVGVNSLGEALFHAHSRSRRDRATWVPSARWDPNQRGLIHPSPLLRKRRGGIRGSGGSKSVRIAWVRRCSTPIPGLGETEPRGSHRLDGTRTGAGSSIPARFCARDAVVSGSARVRSRCE